ncbi:hypothetical protein VP1G_00544 [Cytospora mali]|uniref:Uncharacterized protein n=1 Tax=Cytospora mali TaxID=578113 RepID=A0A194UMM6_CYTMA|nr:hypothetical protein VP1G_00544 [Valsa mali var. pyri (nom. inval.)]
MSSNISRDEFIQDVVGGGHATPQGEADPSSSSITYDGPGSATPTQSADPEPSPRIRKHASWSAFRFRKIQSDQPMARLPTSKELLGILPLDEKMRDLSPVVDTERPPAYKPLIRRYSAPKRTAEEQEPPPYTAPEHPPSVFSRPRVLVLRKLAPETTGRDIIEALVEAADAGKLPRRASRLSDVRVMARFGLNTAIAARLEFMHPEGAKRLHELVARGGFKVRDTVPFASLVETAAAAKEASDHAIGAASPGEDRREILTSFAKRKLRNKTWEGFAIDDWNNERMDMPYESRWHGGRDRP